MPLGVTEPVPETPAQWAQGSSEGIYPPITHESLTMYGSVTNESLTMYGSVTNVNSNRRMESGDALVTRQRQGSIP